MFSFFKSKKHSPDSDSSSEEAPIPRADGGDDDYIMIEKKQGDQPPTNIYPPIPGGNMPYPPYGIPNQPVNNVRQERPTVHNLEGVPFVLSKELLQGDSSQILTLQTSEFMSFVTHNLKVDSMEYDFQLERSIIRSDN